MAGAVRQEGGQGKWAVDTAEKNISTHWSVSDFRDDVTFCFHFYNPQVSFSILCGQRQRAFYPFHFLSFLNNQCLQIVMNIVGTVLVCLRSCNKVLKSE